MKEKQDNSSDTQNTEINTPKSFSISIVWLIPIIALLVGLFLVYAHYTNKGPEITILFKKASGITAGKTKVKFRDVEVGTVTDVQIKDLKTVTIKVEFVKHTEQYLNDNTRFWLVSPHLSITEISGLETLLSGVYIGIEPGEKGKPLREFIALEEPPPIDIYEEGRVFNLRANTLGSLNIGTNIFFRGFEVGQVFNYQLDMKNNNVIINIFVRAPYHNYVYENTRFWDKSGVDIELSADGVSLKSESLASLLAGGITFDLPGDENNEQLADENFTFNLHKNKKDALKKQYRKRKLVIYFDGNLRGLKIGAPVELRGITIGKVIQINPKFDTNIFQFEIPVTVEIEPERLEWIGELSARQGLQSPRQMQILLDKGLRAQLKTGSLLTGALYIDLDIHADAKPAKAYSENNIFVMPSVPSKLDDLSAKINSILDRIDKIPLEQIATNVEEFSDRLNNELSPEMTATMREFKGVARSLRNVADYLDRHPEALLSGKKGEK